MSSLQKLKKEIQSTLKQEKENIFEGHQDESNLQGWIEALEYCIREIELLENNEADRIHQLSKKFHNKYISEEK